MDPKWLPAGDAVIGSLAAFIPGQNAIPAAMVRLDKAIEVDGVAGEWLVMELRYEGAAWAEEGVVHLELCDFEPEAKPWGGRRQGKWIESHATYAKADVSQSGEFSV